VAQFLHDHHPQQLTLIPHQTWHLLPLHLLTLEGRYLAEHYPLRYLPSLQVLRLIREREEAQQGQGVIIDNPTHDPNIAVASTQETETVFKLRGEIDKLLLHEQATLPVVQTELNQAQHSHFSCHGYYAPDLQAGLMLADGNLTAKDLFSKIRLANPRLVVMSACETAQLQPTLADEYMGLASSFLYAGAHTVLATQWRVDAFSSQLLIEDFYQGIIQGLPPILALQQAQGKLKQMPREEVWKRLQVEPEEMRMSTIPYQHPYYWAGFVVIGEGK
jgi:CHAT domain-containing protein